MCTMHAILCLSCFVGLSMAFESMNLARVAKRNTQEQTPRPGSSQWNFLMMPRCFTLQQLEGYKRRFSNMDSSDDGKATLPEVRHFLQMYKSNITDERIQRFLNRRDTNRNGVIDFIPDYVREMARPDYSQEGAAEWFYLEDTNDDGFVTVQELMQIATNLGMSEAEAANSILGYYMSADENTDGKLDWEEYRSLFQIGGK